MKIFVVLVVFTLCNDRAIDCLNGSATIESLEARITALEKSLEARITEDESQNERLSSLENSPWFVATLTGSTRYIPKGDIAFNSFKSSGFTQVDGGTRFVVQESGLYIFEFSEFVWQSTAAYVRMYVNNGLKGEFREDDADGYQRQMEFMLSLELNEGDAIHLYNYWEDSLYFSPDVFPMTFTANKVD